MEKLLSVASPLGFQCQTSTSSQAEGKFSPPALTPSLPLSRQAGEIQGAGAAKPQILGWWGGKDAAIPRAPSLPWGRLRDGMERKKSCTNSRNGIQDC